ncbi:hypothetical protein GGQ87_001706 [Brevundimonas alba]|uniref:BAAT/Acyl-CoA thioester hydrolase C-terminal domain-containing protein n=1 Tax=Brevundimonas alba TaxID=74314 RepID=A0A7X5YK75_9CAUL|nr:acyl-CoA thioester hydrolase/BAAT C-terminal domain-containing protein [Brevundimonas alba]NJC41448.1 hypothetical protein [Brevundimonas alba]
MSLAVRTLLVAAFLSTATPSLAQTQPPPATATPAPTPATVEIRQDGLVADYFAASRPTALGGVIVLGGSEGGLGGSRTLARRLAAEGFNAIAVSYFGEPGQAARLDQIPIEPIGRALAWLAERPEASGPIAIVGVSKGAELALLVASRTPAIRAVAVGVPSNLVWQGIDLRGGPTGSSWTEGGEPLSFAPYETSNGFLSIYRLYADRLPTAPAEAEIQVERINGPILMLSGEADTLWPSAEMARRVENRLRAHDFAYPVIHVAYPDAGHAVFGPPVAADAPGLERALSVGGTIPGLVAARADGWPRLLAFLRTALNDPS